MVQNFIVFATIVVHSQMRETLRSRHGIRVDFYKICVFCDKCCIYNDKYLFIVIKIKCVNSDNISDRAISERLEAYKFLGLKTWHLLSAFFFNHLSSSLCMFQHVVVSVSSN